MPSLGQQNTILGLYVLNQNVPPSSLISNERGVYYSRLFAKPSDHIWYQIAWTDNQTAATFEDIDIDVRVRTGSDLPFNYQTGLQYNFNEFNALIQSATPDVIDGILYRWTLSRSLLGVSGNSTTVNGNLSTNDGVFELGTAFNTSQIPNTVDAAWNYWSLPHLHKTSYISNNMNHTYLQLRIDLRNLNPFSQVLLNPEMFNITISSLLSQGS